MQTRWGPRVDYAYGPDGTRWKKVAFPGASGHAGDDRSNPGPGYAGESTYAATETSNAARAAGDPGIQGQIEGNEKAMTQLEGLFGLSALANGNMIQWAKYQEQAVQFLGSIGRFSTQAFVGGLADGWTNTLKGVFDRVKDLNPSLNINYFSYDDLSGLQAFIDQYEGQLSAIGHSYGADTAAKAAASGHFIADLVTLDPVGHISNPGPDFYKAIADNTGTWTNVNAVGGDSSLRSIIANGLAYAGTKWGDGPLGYAATHIRVNLDHANIVICAMGTCR